MSNLRIQDYVDIDSIDGNELILVSKSGAYRKTTIEEIRNLAADITNTELADLVGKIASAHDIKNILNTINKNLENQANSITEITASLSEKANDSDSTRTTTDKTVTGAINELNTNKANKTDVNSLATNKADSATVQALSTQVNSLASGSPKGSFATVSALQTAYPTGNSNTYVVTADGCWYYWNSTLTTPAWTSGGTYQGTAIGSKTVASNSLMDGLFIKRNYEVSGTCSAAESHLVLVYPVKNGLNVGDTINIQYDALNNSSQQAHITTKIGYITTDTPAISSFSGISGYLTDDYVTTGITKTFSCNYTIPTGSYYVKIYITFAGMSGLAIDSIIKNIKILNSSGENLLLLPYTNGLMNITNGVITATDTGVKDRVATQADVSRIDNDIQAQKTYFDNKFLSKWSGKKANFLGDSQTAGANTTMIYHQYLKIMLGLVEARNYGINGSTIGYGSDSMCTRCLDMDDDADLIVVLGGTNDFNLARPLGTFYTEVDGVRTIREDTGYFRPSLNILCKNLKTKYPDKTIVICTPLHRGIYKTQPTELQANSNSIYFDEYVESVREACKIWSIYCLDLYELSGLQPNLPANAKLYFHDGSDGNEVDLLHMNEAGHEKIANVTAQFLNNIVA